MSAADHLQGAVGDVVTAELLLHLANYELMAIWMRDFQVFASRLLDPTVLVQDAELEPLLEGAVRQLPPLEQMVENLKAALANRHAARTEQADDENAGTFTVQ